MKRFFGVLLCIVAVALIILCDTVAEHISTVAQLIIVLCTIACVTGAVFLFRSAAKQRKSHAQKTRQATPSQSSASFDSASKHTSSSKTYDSILDVPVGDLFSINMSTEILHGNDNEREEPANSHLVYHQLNKLPSEIRELLWVKGEQECSLQEPSLINPLLPVDNNVQHLNWIEDIGYYLSYKGLSPKQRYIYLKWLENVTKPIPIGYVFIFYYGLERHIFTNKNIMALKMISELRLFHKNPSFQAYSLDALLISFKHSPLPSDVINIDYADLPSPLYLLLKGTVANEFDVYDLMHTARSWGFANTRYIKGENGLSDIYAMELTTVLINLYHAPAIPVTEQDFMDSKNDHLCRLANYSLHIDSRFLSISNITTNMQYAAHVVSLLTEAHERTKVKLRKIRSVQKMSQ